MKLAVLAAALVVAGCAQRAAPPPAAVPEPVVADPAIAPEGFFPIRGDGPPPLDPAKALTRIAIGSCSEETAPIPILGALAAARPELFLYIGDNVYGDAKEDMQLPELRQAYADLSINAHFSAFNMAAPILATWDDHDYGRNDAGGDFPAKLLSERLFETFWRDAAVGTERPGVYGSRLYGPPGRRVQVILLDTRFFRSPLKRSDTPNADGYRPYLADADPAKTMLGLAQWAWLAEELKRPAEVRLLVSSIQVLSDGHPFEGWRTLPVERERLYRTIRASGAKGVVLISGDRHVAALYRRTRLAPYPMHELTASSLNLSSVKSDAENSPGQLGRVFTPANFGLVEIDWERRVLTLSVRGMDGAPQRRLPVPFDDLGLS